jgi:glutamate synthase (NADPH/NADH) large chain
LLGFRDVPVDNASLSKAPQIARPSLSTVRSSSAARRRSKDDEDYEAKLYILRKVISGRIYAENNNRDIGAYCVSLSSRTIVYKGMFLAYQLGAYYKDLHDPRFRNRAGARAPALLDQHLPVLAAGASLPHGRHNGEINTVRGNVNWMAARQASVDSPLFGNDISKLWPISYEGQSDTACFDNALEFLCRAAIRSPHAMMMLIPEAWAGNKLMDEDRAPSTNITPR